jgi:NAD(P)H-flavin reductase
MSLYGADRTRREVEFLDKTAGAGTRGLAMLAPGDGIQLLGPPGREFAIPGQVAMEQQMACGLGMCFCCVRDFNVAGEIVHKRVCWDGPVFDILEALP